MNHCRDCNSDYAMPGTCNCFAVGGKRYVAPVVYPIYPIYPWYHPYTRPTPWWADGTGITWNIDNPTWTVSTTLKDGTVTRTYWNEATS